MWSGPRNLSTALMRAFERRADTEVLDEPMYAHYLIHTGLEHPGRQAIVRSQPQTWPALLEWIQGDPPGGAPVWFHKQMAHHVLPEVMGWAWLADFTHAFLIRNPAEVIASYIRRRPNPTLRDLGFETQLALFERAGKQSGVTPPVLCVQDLLRDPASALACLCASLHLRFDPVMLTWPRGRRSTDGVWAVHWYDAVEASTGFRPSTHHQPVALDPVYQPLLQRAQELQQPLWEARLRPS